MSAARVVLWPMRSISSRRLSPAAARNGQRYKQVLHGARADLMLRAIELLRTWPGQEDHEADRWVARTAVWLQVPLVAHDRIFANMKDLELGAVRPARFGLAAAPTLHLHVSGFFGNSGQPLPKMIQASWHRPRALAGRRQTLWFATAGHAVLRALRQEVRPTAQAYY
jgi:hypothetical protein